MDKNLKKDLKNGSQRIWRGNKGYKEDQRYKEELYRDSEKDIIVDKDYKDYDEKGELISLSPNVKIWTNL